LDRNGTDKAPPGGQQPKRRRATIRDVAIAAGVSAMTVSNVINGKVQSVSEETRRRVLREMERRDYRVLSSGRNLRLGNRQAVCVIIVDESPNFLAHPFISRMVSGVCGELSLNGYAMIVQGIQPRDFANTLALRRVEADGYCIRLNGADERRAEMLTALERVSEPVVLMQDILPVSGADHCVVRQDDYSGGRLVADHFAARDVRRLVVAVPRYGGAMTSARLRGLREGFASAGRSVDMQLVVCDLNTFEDAYATLATSLVSSSGLPDAVFGINDELALAAIRVLQDRDIKVPDDVIVAGFNGFNPPGYTHPDLTTVVSCPTEVGAAAAGALLPHVVHGSFERPEVVLPVTFRNGQST
jgi:DNA-binding LacI/PurR family transcriptional regulator